MQVTFFRNRPGVAEANPSAFAPRQLLFAHAALADPRRGRLRHDQRAARAGFGLAGADEASTQVRIDDWSLTHDDRGYAARIAARDFALDLQFAPTQPLLLQGDGGYSRKGPRPRQASYYYSRPQLAVTGTLTVAGQRVAVTGTAWLDHEWSSELMAPEAVGWDWTGINLADGGALMAFRMRDARGRRALGRRHAARRPTDASQRSRRRAIAFAARRVALAAHRRRLPGGDDAATRATREFVLEPLMDDQELDSRASTGTIYWEGAVRALQDGREAGRGYLELTGYAAPLRL